MPNLNFHLYSLASRDPSKIILMCWFATLEKWIICYSTFSKTVLLFPVIIWFYIMFAIKSLVINLMHPCLMLCISKRVLVYGFHRAAPFHCGVLLTSQSSPYISSFEHSWGFIDRQRIYTKKAYLYTTKTLTGLYQQFKVDQEAKNPDSGNAVSLTTSREKCLHFTWVKCYYI